MEDQAAGFFPSKSRQKNYYIGWNENETVLFGNLFNYLQSLNSRDFKAFRNWSFWKTIILKYIPYKADVPQIYLLIKQSHSSGLKYFWRCLYMIFTLVWIHFELNFHISKLFQLSNITRRWTGAMSFGPLVFDIDFNINSLLNIFQKNRRFMQENIRLRLDCMCYERYKMSKLWVPKKMPSRVSRTGPAEATELWVCSLFSISKNFQDKTWVIAKEGAKKWVCSCTPCTSAPTCPDFVTDWKRGNSE